MSTFSLNINATLACYHRIRTFLCRNAYLCSRFYKFPKFMTRISKKSTHFNTFSDFLMFIQIIILFFCKAENPPPSKYHRYYHYIIQERKQKTEKTAGLIEINRYFCLHRIGVFGFSHQDEIIQFYLRFQKNTAKIIGFMLHSNKL